MRHLFLALIRLYQLAISPFLGNCCRFYPTCSQYGHEAFLKHGTLKGLWLTLKRISKCGFWHPGGVDQVPD